MKLDELLNPRNPSFGIFILLLFYTAGFIGIGIVSNSTFIRFTPLNLLLSAAVILYYHPIWDKQILWFVLICYLVGFGIEAVGINTGVIFGEYQYGPVLGPKLFDTSVIIGINWLILVYCSGMLVNWIFPQLGMVFQAAISASIMVVLDVIIEPVAIRYNFWSWEQEVIPMQNYLAWWGISFVLLLLFHYLFRGKQNKVARLLLFLQFSFFGLLNLV